MTLAQTTIDYFIATLFRDYLALTHAEWMALLDREPTSDSAALDIPDSLKRYGMDMGKSPEYPSLLTTAREAEGNTQCRRTVDVSCILQTWLKATDENAAEVAEQLTRGESAAIQIGVENRLRDLDAFEAWVASLDEPRRQGWQIISPLKLANASPQRGERKTIEFAVTITVVVAVARYAA